MKIKIRTASWKLESACEEADGYFYRAPLLGDFSHFLLIRLSLYTYTVTYNHKTLVYHLKGQLELPLAQECKLTKSVQETPHLVPLRLDRH